MKLSRHPAALAAAFLLASAPALAAPWADARMPSGFRNGYSLVLSLTGVRWSAKVPKSANAVSRALHVRVEIEGDGRTEPYLRVARLLTVDRSKGTESGSRPFGLEWGDNWTSPPVDVADVLEIPANGLNGVLRDDFRHAKSRLLWVSVGHEESTLAESFQHLGEASFPLYEGDSEAQIRHLPACAEPVASLCARRIANEEVLLSAPIAGSPGTELHIRIVGTPKRRSR